MRVTLSEDAGESSRPISIDANEAEIGDPAFARLRKLHAHALAGRKLFHRRIVIGEIEPVDVVADRRVGAVEADEGDRHRRFSLALEAAYHDGGSLDDAFEAGFHPRVALLETALAVGARRQVGEAGLGAARGENLSFLQ